MVAFVASTVEFHPLMTPSSETKRKLAGPDLVPSLTTKFTVGLHTLPELVVRLEDRLAYLPNGVPLRDIAGLSTTVAG